MYNYDWNLIDQISSGDRLIRQKAEFEVQKLIRDVGFAHEMNYGKNASSAFDPGIEQFSQFGLDVSKIKKESFNLNSSDLTLIQNKIRNSIDKKQVIYVSGDGSKQTHYYNYIKTEASFVQDLMHQGYLKPRRRTF